MSLGSTLHLPSHIGIIMDGNGRWAKKRRKQRTAGHKEGLNAAKRVVKRASELGIGFVTLYTFSTENWKRAQDEVSFLMNLISFHLKKEMQFYIDNHIRVVHSGNNEGLPANVQKEIADVLEKTAHFDGLTVNLAINYGGRDEIIRSIKKILLQSPESDITIDGVSMNLDQPTIPEPDLIIRTAGENRISNFLLWECAYSELYFCEKYWPDWDARDLDKAIREFNKRERKFGGVV